MRAHEKPRSLIDAFKLKAAEFDLRKNTVQTYLSWVRLYYRFTKRPPSQCSEPEVSAFLVHLQREGYAATSRHQALCALVWTYDKVIHAPLGDLGPAACIKRQRVPKVAPSQAELGRIFSGLPHPMQIIARLMYGGGLRISEAITLRCKDFDFENGTLLIYDSKRGKHRATLFPECLHATVRRQLEWRHALHEIDLREGNGFVDLPGRYGEKNRGARRDIAWQFAFPSARIVKQHRWHITDTVVQRAVKRSAREAGIYKRVTPHLFRHAFAQHLLQSGTDIRVIQTLLGHTSVKTTMDYTDFDKLRLRVRSPLEAVA